MFLRQAAIIGDVDRVRIVEGDELLQAKIVLDHEFGGFHAHIAEMGMGAGDAVPGGLFGGVAEDKAVVRAVLHQPGEELGIEDLRILKLELIVGGMSDGVGKVNGKAGLVLADAGGLEAAGGEDGVIAADPEGGEVQITQEVDINL